MRYLEQILYIKIITAMTLRLKQIFFSIASRSHSCNSSALPLVQEKLFPKRQGLCILSARLIVSCTYYALNKLFVHVEPSCKQHAECIAIKRGPPNSQTTQKRRKDVCGLGCVTSKSPILFFRLCTPPVSYVQGDLAGFLSFYSFRFLTNKLKLINNATLLLGLNEKTCTRLCHTAWKTEIAI